MEDPAIATITEGIANFMLIRRFLANRKVASVVPNEEESLLVATAVCGGSPAIR